MADEREEARRAISEDRAERREKALKPLTPVDPMPDALLISRDEFMRRRQKEKERKAKLAAFESELINEEKKSAPVVEKKGRPKAA